MNNLSLRCTCCMEQSAIQASLY